MCTFRGRQGTRVPDLLERAEDFPLPLRVEDGIPLGVVVAFRAWMFGSGQRLFSPSYGFSHWPSNQPLVASGPVSNSTGRGIYAYHDLATVNEGHGVFGEVALWGDVVEFPNGGVRRNDAGYMAQFAYPLSLWVSDIYGTRGIPVVERRAQSLAERYPGVWVFTKQKDGSEHRVA